ncbi:MAG: hypothetical protein P8I83_03655, partial [Paracoccaceae bacterium]|nr:hypothetical protein [Paracoccaceae bacterium]
ENDSRTMMKNQEAALENVYSAAEFSLSVRTDPISTLTISVYPDEGAANANQSEGKQWFEDLRSHVQDQFFYEGEVMIHKNSKKCCLRFLLKNALLIPNARSQTIWLHNRPTYA